MSYVAMLLYKDILYDARVQREALALAQSGHHVHILCIKEYTKELDSLHDNITVERLSISAKRIKRNMSFSTSSNTPKKTPFIFKRLLIKLIRFPIVKLVKDIASYQEFYVKAYEYMKHSNINWNVIHAHDLNTLWQGIKLKRKFHAKLVYDSHELFNEMAGRNDLDKRFGYYLEGKLLKEVDHLIIVNPFVELEFEKRYGKRPSTIIQNTPINTLDDTEQNNQYFHELYHLSDDGIILIYQGGINPHRGLYKIIETVKLLPSNYYLVMMGDGILKEQLQEYTKKTDLSHRVFFHRQVPSEEVLWYTKQADIGLVMYENTSKNNYYSTPNKIFEYMLAGIPTVASSHPGKKYVIEKEKTGICTEEEPESIKEAILKIAEQYEYFQKQCIHNREFYNWDVEKEKLQKLYKMNIVSEEG